VLLSVVLLAVAGVVAVVVAHLNRGSHGGPTFTTRVPSASLAPTLAVGAIVTVAPDAAYVPQIGDIVLFHPPRGADPQTPVCGNPNQGIGHAPTGSRSSTGT
jgi:signal peptidase I